MLIELIELTLRPGPVLLYRPLHPRDGDGGPVTVDVTDRAIEFLFDPLLLADQPTLADLFGLFERCPELRRVFRREFADELCEEARKGPLPPSRGADPAEAGGIEYLELYRSWALDTATQAYSSTLRLDLHGVGEVLKVDLPGYGGKAGERIKWSVSMTPLRELLPLPVRVNDAFSITEDDSDAKAYGKVVAEARCQEMTLGQLLHGVLWELSFHGGPQQQAEFSDELKRRCDEVDSGEAVLIPAEKVFARFDHFDQPGIETLFDSIGDLSVGQLRDALREIDDDEPAGAWFDERFGGQVRVKPRFREHGGRAFRKAFRAAGR